MSSRASTRTAMKDNRDLTRDPVAKRTSAFHSIFSTFDCYGVPGLTSFARDDIS